MLSEHGAAESPVVTSPSARASVTCETPTPRSWTKSTRTMINWWIPREPPLDCSTNSCTSLFFAPGSRIQECNTRMDTFLLVEPNTEPRMKRTCSRFLAVFIQKSNERRIKGAIPYHLLEEQDRYEEEPWRTRHGYPVLFVRFIHP